MCTPKNSPAPLPLSVAKLCALAWRPTLLLVTINAMLDMIADNWPWTSMGSILGKSWTRGWGDKSISPNQLVVPLVVEGLEVIVHPALSGPAPRASSL